MYMFTQRQWRVYLVRMSVRVSWRIPSTINILVSCIVWRKRKYIVAVSYFSFSEETDSTGGYHWIKKYLFTRNVTFIGTGTVYYFHANV